MIDTDKYEGHTPAPWKASHDVLEYGHIVNSDGWRVYVGEHEKRAEIQNYTYDHDELSEANAQLIADAPLLLEAYKRLYGEPRMTIDEWNTKPEGPCVTVYMNGCEYVGCLRLYKNEDGEVIE